MSKALHIYYLLFETEITDGTICLHEHHNHSRGSVPVIITDTLQQQRPNTHVHIHHCDGQFTALHGFAISQKSRTRLDTHACSELSVFKHST